MATGKIGTKIFIEGEKEYSAAIKNIVSAQRALKAEMKDVSASFKNVANSEEALQKKHDVLTKQLDQAQKKYDVYAKAVEKAKDAQAQAAKELEQMVAAHGKESAEANRAQAEYDRITQKLINYQTAMHNASADVANLSDSLATNDKYLAEAQASADKCAKSIDNLGKETKESKEDVNGMEDALNAIASSVAFEKISAGAEEIAQALMECVEAADQFEYGMAKVQSIARVGDAELSAMGTQIQDLAVKYGASANEIAEATYQAISASVDSADAISFVEDAMTLARGGFTDTVTAVDIMTTALNAFGHEANTTEHIMDALVTTQNLGKTTVAGLAENMGTVIPTAAAYNVSLDNLSAAYIALTKNGINTANATTYISGMLTELADSGSEVGKILKEETGQSFGQLMASGKSLGDVIEILGNTVDGDSEKFANLFGNVRAGRGALTIFNNTAEAFNKSLEAVGDSAGAADEAFATMADTSEMTTKRMEAAMENLRVTVGEALQPTLDGFKEAGIAMLVPLTDFVEANPEIVGALGGVAVAVTGVATAVTAAAAAVTILRVAFGDLTAAASVLGTAAVVGGVLGIAAASDSATDSISKMAANAKDAAKANEEMANNTQASASHIETLGAKIQEYASKTSLTKEEQAVLNGLLAQFNELMPEVNLSYDEATGKIIDNTTALEANVDALVSQAKAAIYQEELDELTKKLAQHTIELEEAESQLADEQERLNADWTGAADLQAVAADEVKNHQKAIEDLNGTVEDEKSRIAELQEKIDDARGTTEEFAEAQDELDGATSQASGALTELAEEYTKAKEAALDSLQGQRDAFQELGQAAREGSEEAKVSMSDIAQGYEDQKKGMQDYIENVKAAMEFMQDNSWSKGLLSSLIESGPEAAAELEAVMEAAEGGEEGIKNLKDTASDFNAYTKLAEEASAYYATLETGVTTIDTAIENNEKLKESTGEIVHAYEDGHAAFVTHAEETTETAAQIPEDAAGAITENAQLVADSETEMLTTAQTAAYTILGMDGEGGQSAVYYDMGASVSQSFADGISSGTDSVSSAMASLCEAAVNAIDVSGLAGKVSETVSKVISEAESNLASNVVASTSRQARMEGGGGHR